MMNFEKIEIGRNEEWIFYRNHFTDSATKWAIDKWKIKNIVAVLVESKMPGQETWDLFGLEKIDPEKFYLLIDTKRENVPIYETTSYESLLYHIDFIGIAKSFK